MSTADILSLVSTIAFIAAGIFAALAILLWFLFKIPAVIGDLSGRTARKSIEKMRKANERTGNKSYRPSTTNAERGQLTDTMSQGLKKKSKTGDFSRPETGLLAENKAEHVEVQQTDLLTDTGGTELLEDENATMPLNIPVLAPRRPGGMPIQMLTDIMLIHTDEVI